MWSVINILFLLLLVSCSSQSIKEKWGSFRAPTLGPSESIGSYNAGCLSGAKTLSLHTKGLIQMRPSREKYYGHSRLLVFLKDLGENFYNNQNKLLLIGDLSQPRGGPTINGHASHQTGLDVDIWFDFVSKRSELTYMDLEHLPAAKYASANELKNWNKDHEQLLLLVVMDERVDRVFVTPPIKKFFCQTGLEEKYLKKIRPWWGHKDHVHVRLSCSSKDVSCHSQDEIESTDCGENLDWWFGDGPNKTLREVISKKKDIVLPKECSEVEKQVKFKGFKI